MGFIAKDPHREEPLLGRIAHSARYEETIHDGKGATCFRESSRKGENFIMGSEVTEFVNKVRMFMAATLNASTFMGKNFSTIQSVVKNHESLTLKQMFDVTAQIVNNEEEINCLDKILCGSQILCHVSAKFFNILNATKLGRTELQEYEPREATEIMMLVEKSMIY